MNSPENKNGPKEIGIWIKATATAVALVAIYHGLKGCAEQTSDNPEKNIHSSELVYQTSSPTEIVLKNNGKNHNE